MLKIVIGKYPQYDSLFFSLSLKDQYASFQIGLFVVERTWALIRLIYDWLEIFQFKVHKIISAY